MAGSPSLEAILLDRLALNSGLDVRRPYVGMSKAGNCSLVIYREYFEGTADILENHAGAWLGYTFERAVQVLLHGELEPGMELSGYGGKLKGHTDGEWRDELVEIKSVTQDKIQQILKRKEIPDRHFAQIQTYMAFGMWDAARVIYVPRDFGLPIVWREPANKAVQDRLDEKFERIINAIDRKAPPPCDCGRCRGGAS